MLFAAVVAIATPKLTKPFTYVSPKQLKIVQTYIAPEVHLG